MSNMPFTSQGDATPTFSGTTGAVALALGVGVKASGTNTYVVAGAGDDGVGVTNATPSDAGATAGATYAVGAAVSIQRGQCIVCSGAAITVGDELTTDAAGKFIKRTAATEGAWGHATTAAGGADEFITAYINPSSALHN